MQFYIREDRELRAVQIWKGVDFIKLINQIPHLREDWKKQLQAEHYQLILQLN